MKILRVVQQYFLFYRQRNNIPQFNFSAQNFLDAVTLILIKSGCEIFNMFLIRIPHRLPSFFSTYSNRHTRTLHCSA